MTTKISRQHHLLHGWRVAGLGLLVLAWLVAHMSSRVGRSYNRGQVLGYATDMSRRQLLADTNQARTGHDLSALKENRKLDASAQAKAEDMIKHNYWSHVSPSGEQPWQFFKAAGYDYQKAGENLAYGFKTADGTVEAWMKSPKHRANILGHYRDVGFGIASSDDYQGGRYTVVVAHYGLPAASPVAGVQAATNSTPPVAFGATENVNYWQQLASGSWSLVLMVSLALAAGAVLTLAFTHRRLLVQAAETGEHLAARHPLVDTGLVALGLTMIMFSRIAAIG